MPVVDNEKNDEYTNFLIGSGCLFLSSCCIMGLELWYVLYGQL